MNERRKCLTGHYSDDNWVVSLLIIIAIITIVAMIIGYGGAFIGGFHSLKNYFISFKHNVYDTNRKPVSVG